MCLIQSCKQPAYYESEEGRCYYHYKIHLDLMSKPNRVPYREDVYRREVFTEYQPMVKSVVNKINLLDPSEYMDLTQHLLTYLWEMSAKVKRDAVRLEITKFLRLSLTQEGVRYARKFNDRKSKEVSLEYLLANDEENENLVYNPEDIFIGELLDGHRKQIVIDFVSTLEEIEGQVFYDMFIDPDEMSLRKISLNYSKSHEWVRNKGKQLYKEFKKYIKHTGYTATQLI